MRVGIEAKIGPTLHAHTKAQRDMYPNAPRDAHFDNPTHVYPFLIPLPLCVMICACPGGL